MPIRREIFLHPGERRVPIRPLQRLSEIWVVSISLLRRMEHHATLHTWSICIRRGRPLPVCQSFTERACRSGGSGDKAEGECEKTLVSLMHANNEIGNILDIICRGGIM